MVPPLPPFRLSNMRLSDPAPVTPPSRIPGQKRTMKTGRTFPSPPAPPVKLAGAVDRAVLFRQAAGRMSGFHVTGDDD